MPEQCVDTDGVWDVYDSVAFTKDISKCFNSSIHFADNILITSCKPTAIENSAIWMFIGSTNALILAGNVGNMSVTCWQHVGSMSVTCQKVANFGPTCVLMLTQK
jgi:hypothetical protein